MYSLLPFVTVAAYVVKSLPLKMNFLSLVRHIPDESQSHK